MLKIINKTLNVFLRKNELMYVVSFIIIILLLSSCDNSYTYVISKQDSLIKVSHTDSAGIVIMPPKVKYAIYTFVVDSNDHVFFYSIEGNGKNGGIYDEPEPDSLHLTPSQVFAIPRGNERSFFEEHVIKGKKQGSIKNIMLASFKDTVTISFLKYLKDISNDKQNKISINVRLALPEERKLITNKNKEKI